MNSSDTYDIIIAGGGLAGLSNALQLSQAGYRVLVIEKYAYPFHRVCGEYISNEVLPFLKRIGADPAELKPASINELQVSSPSGTLLQLPLQSGGFGVSRYTFDYFLYKKAAQAGTMFLLNTSVQEIIFENDRFLTILSDGKKIESTIVIGAFGKRSNLDRQMNRAFFYKRSPYIGVKYHIRTDFPENRIALHNFKDGYCGISKVEGDTYCLCYLSSRENLKQYGNVPEMEKAVLHKNPFLKKIFTESEFVWEKPEVINEISFEKKTAVENHVLMSGDAAGMIAPLCGNGMAMALHSSFILSELIKKYLWKNSFDRISLEKEYMQQWNELFARRLWVGRKIQSLFGNEPMTDITVRTVKGIKPMGNWLVRQTHGKEF